MINYKEIFDAWIVAMKPTDDEKELADKRLSICTTCEHRKEILKGVKWSAYCDACGCPLSKKVFSKIFSACPKGKWKEIDIQSNKLNSFKEKKTII